MELWPREPRPVTREERVRRYKYEAVRLDSRSAEILEFNVGWARSFCRLERGAEVADWAILLNTFHLPWHTRQFRTDDSEAARYSSFMRMLDLQMQRPAEPRLPGAPQAFGLLRHSGADARWEGRNLKL